MKDNEKEKREWIINRLNRNKEIYEQTIKELKENKIGVQLTYPECIKYNSDFSIPYEYNIRMLKEVIKGINGHLRIKEAKRIRVSVYFIERKKALEKHLIELRKLRERRYFLEENK